MEQKKTFRIGKLNIVDMIAIILLLAVAAYAVFRLSGKDDTSVVTIPITYVVRVEGVPEATYDACQEHLPSTLMAKGALLNGQIESVEKAPFLVLSPDGEWVEDPEHVTLYFTCKANVVRGSVLTNKVGEQEIRIGKPDYILKSEYIEFQNTIVVDVEWGE